MSQSVYAAEAFEPPNAPPARTSVLATLSLVTGVLSLLLCCIPVVGPALGLLGAVMGIGAIISISGSDGRLGGKGLASAGLVTSVLGIVVGATVLLGLFAALGQVRHYGSVMAAIEAGDLNTATPLFSAGTPAPLTAEVLQSFRDRYGAVLGPYREAEKGAVKVLMAAATMSSRLGSALATSTDQPIPMMGVFERGQAAIIFIVDKSGPVPSLPMGPVINIVIIPDQGNPIWLFDPAPTPPATPSPAGP
jgi:hypothetical protein